MLQSQTVPISISGALDTKQDPKLVLEGRFLRAQNAVIKSGAQGQGGALILKLQKRYGYDSLPTTILGGGEITSGDALAVFRDELLHFDKRNLRSYSDSQQGWKDKGQSVPLVSSVKSVVRNSASQTQSDAVIFKASTGGVILYAWLDSVSGIRASVIDEQTGNEFQSDVLVAASGQFPKCVQIQGFLYVVYVEGTSYKQRRVDPLNPSVFNAAVTIATDVHATTKNHDIQALSTLGAIFSYRNTAGNLKIAYMTRDGAEGTVLDGFPNAITRVIVADGAIAVIPNTTTFDFVVSVYSSVSNLVAYGLSSNFTPLFVGATTLDAPATAVKNITGVFESDTLVAIFYEVFAADASNTIVKKTTLTVLGVAGVASVLLRSVGLASRAFIVNDSTLMLLVHDSPTQATYFLVASDGAVLGKFFPGVSGGLTNGPTLPSILTDSSGRYFTTIGQKNRLVSEGGALFTLTGVTALLLDFTSPGRFFSAETEGTLIIAGGVMAEYDGASVYEQGFHLFPESFSFTSSTTGGFMSDGTYLYYPVYEWTDNSGQVQRSAPGIPISVVLTGGTTTQQVTLSIGTLRLTAKTTAYGRKEVVVAAFRTENNGSIAYRVTPISAPVFNNPAVDSVSVIDGLSDASLISNELIYTTGGVLENTSPPSSNLIHAQKNRVFYVSPEDPNTVGYSKKMVAGEAVEFSDALKKRIGPEGGNITAIFSLDEKILIFKKRLMYFFSGDGPNDTGTSDQFTDVQLITADVGCIDPSSLSATPVGVVFKSEKGIYILGQDLSVKYVGAKVEQFNAQNVTSADLLSDVNQVRFLTSSGSELCFNYYFDEWTTASNHEGKDAVVWRGVYAYLRNNGTVFVENSSKYLDDNTPYSMLLSSSWIKLAGVQGFQRVRRLIVLGDYFTDHKLVVRVGYDYELGFSQEYIFDAGAVIETETFGDDPIYGSDPLYGGDSDGVYQFRVHLERQKCQSVRFEFEDVMSDTYGQSFSLSELALEVGSKQGLNKLRDNKTL